MTPKFHEPFSPSILETTVPQRFVDIVNDVADDVLSSEKKSKQWDWSHKLVGKVSKEIQIPSIHCTITTVTSLPVFISRCQRV